MRVRCEESDEGWQVSPCCIKELYALFSGFKAGSWANIHHAVPDLFLNSPHCPETDGDN